MMFGWCNDNGFQQIIIAVGMTAIWLAQNHKSYTHLHQNSMEPGDYVRFVLSVFNESIQQITT